MAEFVFDAAKPLNDTLVVMVFGGWVGPYNYQPQIEQERHPAPLPPLTNNPPQRENVSNELL